MQLNHKKGSTPTAARASSSEGPFEPSQRSWSLRYFTYTAAATALTSQCEAITDCDLCDRQDLLTHLLNWTEDTHGAHKGHIEEQGNAQAHVIAIPDGCKDYQ